MKQKIALQNVQGTRSLIFKILNAHYCEFPLSLLFSRIPFAVACLGALSVLGPASGSEVETEETFKRFSLLKTKQNELGVEWGGPGVASVGRKKESIGTSSPISPLRHSLPPPREWLGSSLGTRAGEKKSVHTAICLSFLLKDLDNGIIRPIDTGGGTVLETKCH